ncbi:MAG: thioredoxin domain-containing protein [Candidatus Acidiferrum sp.]
MHKTYCQLAFVLGLFALLVASLGAVPRMDKRPLVLVVYADWCPSCQHLKPVLALINEKYHDKIRFVRFDITSEETLAKSQQRVEKLGLAKFFEKNHDQTSLVVILDAAHREVFRTVNDYNPEHYEAALDQQLQAADAR